jgi:hypothetical protein
LSIGQQQEHLPSAELSEDQEESEHSRSSKRELHQHQAAMDESLAQMADFNPEMTIAMEQYKLSESSPFEF